MKRQQGFTLTELIIAVVIIGVLISFAVPGYVKQVKTARRADAQSSLRQLANAMERYYTKNPAGMSYAGATLDPASTAPPPIMTQWVPRDGNATTANYELMILSADDSEFVIAAVPVAGNPQAADECGAFLMNSRTQVGNLLGATNGSTPDASVPAKIDGCWN